ncbi:glycosyltransferase [Opitutales bacterium]|nr:glycosyltransferase [Opitutales bacterium]
MSRLLLLTTNYPYGEGETFIESEIETLGESFDEVCIIPSRRIWNLRELGDSRPLPLNVRVLLPGKTTTSSSRFWGFLGLLCVLPIELVAAVAKYDLRLEKSAGLALVNAVKDVFKVGLISSWLRIVAKDRSFDVAYAYWKAEVAVSAAHAKERGWVKAAVARAHRYDLYPEAWPLGYNPFDRYLKRWLDTVYSISQDGVETMRGIGYAESALDVSRLGVREAQTLCEPSIDGVIRMLSVSRVVPIKRLDYIVEALKHTPSGMEIHWTHLGDGYLFDSIEEQIKSLPENVIVSMPGSVPNVQVLDYYKKQPVDVFINISESEGVPVSIMEALSHGVPCAATDVGGVAELINASNGRVLDVNCTPSEIIEAIIGSANKPQLRESALETWRSLSDRNKNFGEFAMKLKELC